MNDGAAKFPSEGRADATGRAERGDVEVGGAGVVADRVSPGRRAAREFSRIRRGESGIISTEPELGGEKAESGVPEEGEMQLTSAEVGRRSDCKLIRVCSIDSEGKFTVRLRGEVRISFS